MSRFAEASARAGCAVPDNPRVDWAKERETAERLLSDATPEQPASSPTTAESPLASDSTEETVARDSTEQAFSWPAEFDLDQVDLSRDPHARRFRRPRPTTGRRVHVDAPTAPRPSQVHQNSVGSSRPTRLSTPPRETAASSERGTHGDVLRPEARRVIPLWVVIAVGLLVLVVSAALLTYLLRDREVASGSRYVHPSQSAWVSFVVAA